MQGGGGGAVKRQISTFSFQVEARLHRVASEGVDEMQKVNIYEVRLKNPK